MNIIFEKIPQLVALIPDFFTDALVDSVKLIPFLFVIFVFIELFENYFSKKIVVLLKFSQKVGPVLGALFAIVPQCGFSIVASMLYVKNFISIGTLVAVYIGTSDEAIPILLSNPNEIGTVGKIILIKLILAIVAGYLTDLIFKSDIKIQEQNGEFHTERGCCNHNIHETKWKSILLHPIKHTTYIFLFIFAVCLTLNYLFETFGIENISRYMLQNSIFQPIVTGIFGLIPNCAVSVLITMMFLKGTISFGSAIAGLSSGAGLGLLVLIKKNDNFKNTMLVIAIVLLVSIIAGIVLQTLSL